MTALRRAAIASVAPQMSELKALIRYKQEKALQEKLERTKR